MSNILLFVIAFFLTIYVTYNLFLVFIHLLFLPKESKHCKNKNYSKALNRFAVIIPAHNEELLLPRLIESAQGQDYPCDLFNIIVVADNCTDNTAIIARQNGVTVLERFDLEKRGKGYAIKWALGIIILDQYDAVVIIDADCVMNCSALQYLNKIIQKNRVIQCYVSISNPNDSWLTKLSDVSKKIETEIYLPAKQKLGLSSYLLGAGICFPVGILQRYGWDAFTVGEDLEYYAKLALQGESICFAYDAKIFYRESSSLKQATSQRMRWSSGKFAIAWKYGIKLLLRGLTERNIVKFDAALPLIFPNHSLSINISLVGLLLSFVLPVTHKFAFVGWFITLCLIQVGIFILGIFYTNNKFNKFIAIFFAPLFLIWKMAIDCLSALGLGRKKWVRTERKL